MIGAGMAVRLAGPIVNAIVARRAGRAGLSKPSSRQTFLSNLKDSDTLEIGPFDKPIVVGPWVSYFDVLDTDGLKERAARLGRSPESVPHIDFHSPIGDMSVIDRAFDTILSSHAIEHQPDLIAHLNTVASLLRPGGRYYVIVPDKRFSFDYFQVESTLEDVVAANSEGHVVHTRKAVLAHHLATTHNSAFRHWVGIHGRPGIDVDDRARVHAETEAVSADRGDYVDVHAWFLSPLRLREIVNGLRAADLIELDLVDVHETGFAELEFFAIFEKPAVK